MENLKKLLQQECDRHIDERLMESLLAQMDEIRLKVNEPLIEYGALDDNLYIVKSGIMRLIYFDGLKEKTHGFCTPGTMVMSMYPYYRRQPSFYQFEACCDTVVLKISKKEYYRFIERSHDFCLWMLDLAHAQMWASEMKQSVINGSTAKERFQSLIKNRPEIMESVSLKIIASYLGITPEYLSILKRKLTPPEKK